MTIGIRTKNNSSMLRDSATSLVLFTIIPERAPPEAHANAVKTSSVP